MWSFSLKYLTNFIYSLLKLPLLGYEPKHADFEYVALNANELLFPEKRAELQELKLH